MRLIAFLLALFLPALPALAGDLANREILGFSPDGHYFAFEEYGVQDGSGFPYSNIYVIDTASDSWVRGSPVRVMIRGDSPPLVETRLEAKDRARDLLLKYEIGAPGEIVASNPPSELSADPHRVKVSPRPAVWPHNRPIELSLREIALPGKEICKDWGQTKGFELTMTRDGKTRTMHRDSQIPSSRGCPLGYRIGDVVTYHPGAGDPVIAVLILMEQVGFEGPDGRWLAVTGDLR